MTYLYVGFYCFLPQKPFFSFYFWHRHNCYACVFLIKVRKANRTSSALQSFSSNFPKASSVWNKCLAFHLVFTIRLFDFANPTLLLSDSCWTHMTHSSVFSLAESYRMYRPTTDSLQLRMRRLKCPVCGLGVSGVVG